LHGYLSSNGSADTTCGFRFGTSSGSYSDNFTVGIISSGVNFSNNNGSLNPGQIYFYQAWATNSKGFANGSEMTVLLKPNPVGSGNFIIQTNSSSMIFLQWTKGTGANNTYIEINASGVTVWARGDGTEIYNGTGVNYEATGLLSNVTYYFQAWSFANWTYNPTIHRFSDGNESGSNTTKKVPVLSSESPTNESTGISLNPTTRIQANHGSGYQMNISWYWGIDSSCPNYYGINSSVSNGTYYMTNDANFSTNSQTYYWKVCVNDGHGEWTNETYHFTTIGADKEILSKGQAVYSLEINPGSTTLYGYINDNVISTSFDTDWHYVALSFDGSILRLYKDGEEKNSGASGSITYGDVNVTAGHYFTGDMDELRISSTRRTAAWINTTFQNINDPESFATLVVLLVYFPHGHIGRR